MKIIYIANSRIPTTKAHGFQIIKMCEAFKNAGIDVELWLPKRLNPIKDSIFDHYGVHENFVIKRIPVIDLIPIEKILGPLANIIESITFAFFVKFYLSQIKDGDTLIYSRDLFSLFFSNKKYILEIHSFPTKTGLYKRIWQGAYKIITITGGLRDLLIKQGISSDKIMIAPDGVDLSVFNAVTASKRELRTELNLPQENFLVGYVGKFKTLQMEKGIKTMIETLSLLDKDTRMVFVGGEESEIRDYKALANRFNVLSQCIFIDYQPYIRAVKYIKAMDTLVIPFPNEPHYAFYASPLKLFEYMASGQPIIASDLPALREILNEKNALFFKPGDVSDLARAIKMLKGSQMLGRHLSQQALADVKEYTWDKRAQKILDFIR